MEIPATKENRVLASAVNARIKSDARRHNAQAAFYRLAGWGVLCGLLGAGVGAACYGYAYLNPPNSTENVAAIVAKALSAVTFKTEGTVALAPGSQVKLDPAALAAMKSPEETPKPTAAQLGTGTDPASQIAVTTNFTVFKNVPYGSGQVVTGWNFSSSEEKTPAHQYCYYSEQLDGTSKVTIDLGDNGHPLAQAKARTSVDPIMAYANCVWFKGAT